MISRICKLSMRGLNTGNLMPVAVLGATMCLTGELSAQRVASVRADVVASEKVQEQRPVTGNLRAVARSRVASLESGRVIAFSVREGESVQRGDVLARLDDRRLQLQLQQLEAHLEVQRATLAEREAQVELRRSDLETLAALEHRGAVNPKELADARAELQIARARRDQAERDLDITEVQMEFLRTRLDDTVIRAPFDGIVSARHTELGEWIAEGAPVVELLSTKAFEVWLDVPQRFVEAVSRNELQAMVHVTALNRTLETAGSSRVVREVNPTARTFSLVLTMVDEKGLLAPGMSVTAWIPTGGLAEQLTVHKDGLMRGESGEFVYIVQPGAADGPEQAVPVQVEPVFNLRDRVVVRSSRLQPGDRVIVEGNERLHPMAPVRVVEVTQPDAAVDEELPRTAHSQRIEGELQESESTP